MNSIDQVLLKEIKQRNSPSVQYYFFNKERVVKYYCAGLASIREQKPVEENTGYHAYSVTKTFTALAVMQLVEQRLIKLDDPMILHLPGFPYGDKITIRQVLSHSAGIPNPMPLNWIHLVEEDTTFNRDAFFDAIFAKHSQTKFAPNEKFAYSNLGYILLGRLVERITGKTYEAYLAENVFARLNLSREDLGFTILKPECFATGYQKNLSFMNLLLGLFIKKGKFMGKTEREWKPFNPFYVNGVSYGGLIGKPSAFVKYVQALLNDKSGLISPAYKNLLFQENRNNKGEATGMCLSWFKGQLNGENYFTHAGGGGGYYCEIRIYPAIEMGSVIFFNRTGMSDERFLDRVDRFFVNDRKHAA